MFLLLNFIKTIPSEKSLEHYYVFGLSKCLYIYVHVVCVKPTSMHLTSGAGGSSPTFALCTWSLHLQGFPPPASSTKTDVP